MKVLNLFSTPNQIGKIFFIFCSALVFLSQSSIEAQTYCSPTYTNSCGSWGTNSITIGSFTHSPACGTNNYLSQVVTLTAGIPVSSSLVSIGWCAVGIAADFNSDGDFADAGEVLDTPAYIAQSTATYNMTTMVPPSVPTGNYRLRVWNRGGNSGGSANWDACGTYGYGRWADYTLSVLNSTSCNPPISISITPTLLSASVSFAAPLVGNSPTSFLYQLRMDGTTPASGNVGLVQSGSQSTTTLNFNNLYQGTTYSLYLRTFCSPGDSSGWVLKSFATLADTFITVPLSNFNADIVANGIGSALSSTNNDADNVNYALVSADFQVTPTSALPSNSVPISRIYRVQNKKYKLNYYNTNNSLRMPGISTGKLILLAPKRANIVRILGVSGSGASSGNVTIHFHDGTSQSQAIGFPDWYVSSNNVASYIGRVLRSSNALQTGSNLHDTAISILMPNRVKQIDSITFSKTGGVLNILAVSTLANNTLSCTAPENLILDSINCNNAYVHWNGINSNYQISYGNQFIHADSGTIVNFNSSSCIIPNTGSGLIQHLFVRSSCGNGDYSDWIGPVDLVFPTIVPAFSIPDTVCINGATSILPTTSNNGIQGAWSPTTINTTATTTYVFTSNSGQCATSFTKTIPVVALKTPTFNLIAPICFGSVPPILPANSTNGITGTWSPTTINNTKSGTYTFTPNNSNPYTCAIPTTLVVSVKPKGEHRDSVTICQNALPYTWNGQTVTTGGIGVGVIQSTGANGCDSSSFLDLFLTPLTTPTLSLNVQPTAIAYPGQSITITANITNGGTNLMYKWYKNGVLLQAFTTNTWTGVAGTDFAGLDSIGVTVTGLSCSTDSIVSQGIKLEVKTAIQSLARPNFNIYPNPTEGDMYISGLNTGDMYKVYDFIGKLLKQELIESSKQKLELSGFANGQYLIQIITSEGDCWKVNIQKNK